MECTWVYWVVPWNVKQNWNFQRGGRRSGGSKPKNLPWRLFFERSHSECKGALQNRTMKSWGIVGSSFPKDKSYMWTVPRQIFQLLSPLLQSSHHSWTPVFFSSDFQPMSSSSWREKALCDLWSDLQEEQCHWESKRQIYVVLLYLCKKQKNAWFSMDQLIYHWTWKCFSINGKIPRTVV